MRRASGQVLLSGRRGVDLGPLLSFFSPRRSKRSRSARRSATTSPHTPAPESRYFGDSRDEESEGSGAEGAEGGGEGKEGSPSLQSLGKALHRMMREKVGWVLFVFLFLCGPEVCELRAGHCIAPAYLLIQLLRCLSIELRVA